MSKFAVKTPESVGPTCLGIALLSPVDEKVTRALRAERQDQVLCQSWDE